MQKRERVYQQNHCISTFNSCQLSLFDHFNNMNNCHLITIFMYYCFDNTYIYHKTYNVALKVHASLLMNILNFLLFAIFTDVLSISMKLNLIWFVYPSTGKLCIIQTII